MRSLASQNTVNLRVDGPPVEPLELDFEGVKGFESLLESLFFGKTVGILGLQTRGEHVSNAEHILIESDQEDIAILGTLDRYKTKLSVGNVGLDTAVEADPFVCRFVADHFNLCKLSDLRLCAVGADHVFAFGNQPFPRYWSMSLEETYHLTELLPCWGC